MPNTATRFPLERFCAIARAARAGGMKTRLLASVLGVSTKTIQRDVEFLRERMAHDLVYDPLQFAWRYRTLPQCVLL